MMGSVKTGALSADSLIGADDGWVDVSADGIGLSNTEWKMDGCDTCWTSS